jgi:hypothetical protein
MPDWWKSPSEVVDGLEHALDSTEPVLVIRHQTTMDKFVKPSKGGVAGTMGVNVVATSPQS